MVTTVVWEFVPDVGGRRRLRTRVRLVTLTVGVGVVVLGWTMFEAAGGIAGVLLMLIAVLVIEAWGRGNVVDGGPQRVMVDGGLLRFEGPDLYVRPPDSDVFEGVLDAGHAGVEATGAIRTTEATEATGTTEATDGDARVVVIPIELRMSDVRAISVYPAITRGDAGESTTQFHLVVDAHVVDGSRTCVSFDRRLPMRIGGERSLETAIGELFGDRLVDPPPDDPFGEIDHRRLADWHAS